MSQELVVSSNPIETTVAIREDDRLVEIHVERDESKAIVGNIYKGRVTRVLPGMQSAFVDIGLERDAFLYVTDVAPAAAPESEVADGVADGPDVLTPGMPAAAMRTTDGEPAASAAGTAAADDVANGAPVPGRSRRRGRRRAKRTPANGAERPETEISPGQPATAAEASVPAPDQPRHSMNLLPGESLSKYRDPGAPRASADAVAADNSGTSTRSAPGRPPVVAPEPDPDPVAGPAPGSIVADREAFADSRGSGEQSDDGAVEPPLRSARVRPPSTLAEFWNPLKWIKKGRPEAPAKTAGEAQAESRPASRSRRGRRAKAPAAGRGAEIRKPQAGQPSDTRAAGSSAQRDSAQRRSGRRPSTGKRPRRQQAKQGSRPEHAKACDSKPAESPPVRANIADLLSPEQEVIVQASKEPVGEKGARVTCHVSLPGHYMVYMTTAEHDGVTKQIQSEAERRRLRKLVAKHSEGKEGGFVVRTSCSGVGDEELVADMEHLQALWSKICERASQVKAPAELHSDLDIAERIVREHLSEDYKAVWVDSVQEHKRIVEFVERFQPNLVERVKLYTKKQPIHDAFGITKDLRKALRPKVWLKSGGYLVINQTEALVAIDVNTGRFVGQSDRLEDTVLRTNLEAADEIVRQLRLRDLGGIIVVDFIDMEDRKNRQQVYQVMQTALRQMRSPTRLLPFNDFGLVVITRKSVRQSLERSLCVPCPACSGAGTVKSSETVMSEIFSAASRQAKNGDSEEGIANRALTLRVHPQVARSLKRKGNHLQDLQTVAGANVTVRGDVAMNPEDFSLK